MLLMTRYEIVRSLWQFEFRAPFCESIELETTRAHVGHYRNKQNQRSGTISR
ncbi:hypothetical protein Pan241w_14930 [Gimesia alba]|uniref:Uncharacterized protein n=1 Tax=Gimesia alba TaxID=2527973 RepID=A0A517RC28_9PLAN|nr:hypothetical protein Pan241w_14930 [Gimesia alba]